MKNVIKKISAIAMAFTLFGTGSTIAKNNSTESKNGLTASAAWCPAYNCQHYSVRVQDRVDGFTAYYTDMCIFCGTVFGHTVAPSGLSIFTTVESAAKQMGDLAAQVNTQRQQEKNKN